MRPTRARGTGAARAGRLGARLGVLALLACGCRDPLAEPAGSAASPASAPVVAPAPASAPVVAASPASAPVVAPSPASAPVVAPAPASAPVVAPAAAGESAAAAGPASVRSLLAEAARAELAVGGLTLALGTADGYKYTRGGWRSGWGAPRVDGTTTAAPLAGARARLWAELLAGEAPEAVVVRVRATRPGRRLAVVLGGAALGEAAVGTSYAEVSYAVPAARRRAGAVELELRLGGAGDGEGLVETVWLRAGPAGGAPVAGPRVLPLKLAGGTRRALVAPTPRRYSYYVEVPAGAVLRFDQGARAAVTFVVRAQRDGAEARELYRAAATPGAWRRAVVPLGELGGAAVRLDLVTEGGAGVAGWGEPELVTPPAPALAVPHGAAARNAIVVVMDATRAALFPEYEPTSPVVAPALAALAREGTLFVNAYSNANWTRPSGATLITGLYPARHGVRSHQDRLGAQVATVGQHLGRAGFATAYFTQNPQIGPPLGFGAGWSYARAYRDLDPRAATWTTKPDPGVVFDDALAWITAHRRERCYVHVHTMGSHAPYRLRPGCTDRYHPGPYAGPYREAITPRQLLGIAHRPGRALTAADRAWVRALYQGEATCHDQALGRFVDRLRRAGLLDTTLLVVTADHGEGTGEHELYGHGWSVYDEEVRVPLVARQRALFPAGARIGAPAEHVDLVPTVLEALGLPPMPDVDGVSLLSAVRGAPAVAPPTALAELSLGYPAMALRLGRYKLMVVDDTLALPQPPPPPGQSWLPRAVARPGVRLFDLAADPGEAHPLEGARPITRRLLEVHLGEALAVPPKTRRQAGLGAAVRHEAGRAVIDPRLKRELEALGYLAE